MSESKFEFSNNVMDNLLRASFGVKENNLSRSSEFVLDDEDDARFHGLHKMCVDFTEDTR